MVNGLREADFLTALHRIKIKGGGVAQEIWGQDGYESPNDSSSPQKSPKWKAMLARVGWCRWPDCSARGIPDGLTAHPE